MKREAAAVRVHHTGMMQKIGKKIMCMVTQVVEGWIVIEECRKNIVQIIKRVRIAK